MAGEAKERGILFSAPMVLALLDRRKTQTRRVVKPQPSPCQHKPWSVADTPNWVCDEDGWHCATCGNGVRHANSPSGVTGIRCPYGKVGDRLWVREVWTGTWHGAPKQNMGQDLHIQYRADGGERIAVDPPQSYVLPKAAAKVGNWVTPLFLPRWASRLTLEITDVRVQRLQDISEEDALAEGIPHECDGDRECPYRTAFSGLWRSINGEGSWDANPWVWAVTFKKVGA